MHANHAYRNDPTLPTLRSQFCRQLPARHLDSLLGKLSFASRVVCQGSTFLRRRVDLRSRVSRTIRTFRVDDGAYADILWWQHFLSRWNGWSLILETDWTSAAELDFHTDASGALGFGAVFGIAWFSHLAQCFRLWSVRTWLFARNFLWYEFRLPLTRSCFSVASLSQDCSDSRAHTYLDAVCPLHVRLGLSLGQLHPLCWRS